ncbi:MAG TPA: exosortase [Steroidobacteraceae bacterium]|nr:exosortase [Steroidobacteraceae bacterium]
MSELTTSEACNPRAHAEARRVTGLALIFAFWAAVALIYWPSALELNRLWTDLPGETYTHGYLVFLLSLWLIVRDRRRLAVTPARPAPVALIPLAILSVAWVFFWRAAIQEPQLMLLPLILYAALFAACGRHVARAVAFPIGFIYFALPFWGDINGITQALSAKMVGVLIWATGIPAYTDGVMVHLPGGLIEIAQSCSGLHEFIVGLALAALYGKLSDEPWRHRLRWLALMGVLSLAVNWVRIFTVIVAAYESEMRSSLVRQHYWLGWWLFAFVFAAFLWWTGRSAPAHRAASSAESSDTFESPSAPSMGGMPVILTLAVLAAMPVLAYGTDWANTAASTAMAVQWPEAPAGWAGPSTADATEWRPRFVNSSVESLTRYTDSAGNTVEAFAVAYRVQTQRAKLLGYSNHLLGDPKRTRQLSVQLVDSPAGRWQEIVALDSNGSRALVWTRYRIGSRLFVQPRLSQLWYGLAATLKPPVSSLATLRAACVPDCNAARARLSAAATWLQPVLR